MVRVQCGPPAASLPAPVQEWNDHEGQTTTLEELRSENQLLKAELERNNDSLRQCIQVRTQMSLYATQWWLWILKRTVRGN